MSLETGQIRGTAMETTKCKICLQTNTLLCTHNESSASESVTNYIRGRDETTASSLFEKIDGWFSIAVVYGFAFIVIYGVLYLLGIASGISSTSPSFWVFTVIAYGLYLQVDFTKPMRDFTLGDLITLLGAIVFSFLAWRS